MLTTLSLEALNERFRRSNDRVKVFGSKPLSVQDVLDRYALIGGFGQLVPPNLGDILCLWVSDTERRYFVFGSLGWRTTTQERVEHPTTYAVTVNNKTAHYIAVDADAVFERVRSIYPRGPISIQAVSCVRCPRCEQDCEQLEDNGVCAPCWINQKEDSTRIFC